MKVYLSSPITGIEPSILEERFKVLKTVAQLMYPDCEIENPIEWKPVGYKSYSWTGWMYYALVKLSSCDAVVMDRNYQSSNGCIIEYHWARQNKMKIDFVY